MRRALTFVFLVVGLLLSAAPVTIHLTAPTHAGERVFLYRTLDLFTGRQEVLTDAYLDAEGRATLKADIDGTVKATLRIQEVRGDLFLRTGSYHVGFPALPDDQVRTLNGTARVALDLHELDVFDVNMLTTDLYERLDAFVAEGLTASRVVAHPLQKGDSLHQQASRFVNSKDHQARIDTLERKLVRFYADVPDPWFQQELTYQIADLHLGPRTNDRALFDRYLKDRPVLYDVPAYARFIGDLFHEHLLRFPFRNKEGPLLDAIRQGDRRALMALMAEHDFLRGNDRLTELVMMNELYLQHWGKLFDRRGGLRILEEVAQGSEHPEHRLIAADMVWDLTAMKPGGRIPSLKLSDATGSPVLLDSLLQGNTLLLVTADWCTYCEQELSAAEQLHHDFGEAVRFVGIMLTDDPATVARYRKAHPQRNWTWLVAGNDGTAMETLRLRSIPTFLLLENGVITHHPAPAPLSGLGTLLHPIKVKAAEQRRVRPDRGAPPKR